MNTTATKRSCQPPHLLIERVCIPTNYPRHRIISKKNNRPPPIVAYYDSIGDQQRQVTQESQCINSQQCVHRQELFVRKDTIGMGGQIDTVPQEGDTKLFVLSEQWRLMVYGATHDDTSPHGQISRRITFTEDHESTYKRSEIEDRPQ